LRFFKRDDDSGKSASAAEPHGVPPITSNSKAGLAEIESALTSNGWTYRTTEDGTCVMTFSLPDGALIPYLVVAIIPVPGFVMPRSGREPLESPSEVRVVAHSGVTFSQDDLDTLLRACNNWNRTQRVAVASLRTNTDSGELDLFVEGSVLAGQPGQMGSLGRNLERIINDATEFCVRLSDLREASV
jgi:hypothetical protein